MDSLPTQFSSTPCHVSNPHSDPFLKYALPELSTSEFAFTHATTLVGAIHKVTSIAVDPPGVRCLVGSQSGTLKMYDFAGMSQGKPFRSIDSLHPVTQASWSDTGDLFLLAHGSQLEIYDRHGQRTAECAKGDMYIRDPRHTDGHTGAITAVQWSPTERSIFASSSADSTIRIWDIDHPRKQKHVIVFKYGSGARGLQSKAPVTTLAYSKDGSLLAGGCEDGSFRIWKAKGPYLLPPFQQPKAHTGALVSIDFSLDGQSFLTRSLDDTVAQWDVRRLTSPLHRCSVPSTSHHNAMYCPKDTRVVLGTGRSLQVYSKTDFQMQSEWSSTSEVTKVVWHEKYDQCFLGTVQGTVEAFFNLPSSSKPLGVAMHLDHSVLPKVDDLDDLLLQRAEASTIFVPGANGEPRPGFGNLSGRISKRQYEKMRQDPKATRLPERPKPVKATVGGVISDRQLLHTLRDVDPREALLKYAEEAASDPYWVAPAYKHTQPQPVLAKTVFDEEEESRIIVEEERQKGKRRKI